MFDEEAQQRHELACRAACDEVHGACDVRHRERVSLDGHVACVFERSAVWKFLLAAACCSRCLQPVLLLLQCFLSSRPTWIACPCCCCRSPYCHAVVRGHVLAVFAGEIAGGHAAALWTSALSGCHPRFALGMQQAGLVGPTPTSRPTPCSLAGPRPDC